MAAVKKMTLLSSTHITTLARGGSRPTCSSAMPPEISSMPELSAKNHANQANVTTRMPSTTYGTVRRSRAQATPL